MTLPERPFVSIILAVRNEEEFIERTLAAIAGQTYPAAKMEIIVADGMSTDRTRDVVRSLHQKHPSISLIENPQKIVSTGLNRALLRASGDIIVRVDGHTILAPDYVEQAVAALDRSGAENVGGRMTAVGEGVVAGAIALATSSPFGVGGAKFHYSQKEEQVDTVYLGAWRRGVFETFGLFDEEQVRNQDDEFNYRTRKHGGTIVLTPLMKSEYHSRKSLPSLARQYFEYGFWKVRVLQKHPAQMNIRHVVPAVFVGTLLAGGILAPFSLAAAKVATMVLAAYCAANLAASIFTAAKNGTKYFLLLPVTFAIMHCSYGIGFLAGFAKFGNAWRRRGRIPTVGGTAKPGQSLS